MRIMWKGASCRWFVTSLGKNSAESQSGLLIIFVELSSLAVCSFWQIQRCMTRCTCMWLWECGMEQGVSCRLHTAPFQHWMTEMFPWGFFPCEESSLAVCVRLRMCMWIQRMMTTTMKTDENDDDFSGCGRIDYAFRRCRMLLGIPAPLIWYA